MSNRDKLSTIDQAMESEDVKAALERNPDISKERSNLLQGTCVCLSVCVCVSECVSVCAVRSLRYHLSYLPSFVCRLG